MAEVLTFKIENKDGLRLDKFLAESSDVEALSISRERLKQLIQDGHVKVNRSVIIKPAYKLTIGSQVELSIPEAEPLDLKPENLAIDIVFEDEHCLVVNKPRGMLTHPTPSETTGTLVNALLYHCEGNLSEINGVIRPGIVHRLDRDTSGLLMVAKTNQAHHHLADQIKQKTAKREYQAIVQGIPKEEKSTANFPVGRNPKQREKMCVISTGRYAITHWKTKETAGTQYSLLHCQLQTGRTHQIRVHLSHIGHPIVGDILYGTGLEKIKKFASKGQCLQAVRLSFTHPATEKHLIFSIDLDPYMTTVWEKLLKETGTVIE